jgi:CBS domain-containing protein
MQVKDVMTRSVRTCRPGTNLAEAVREMWEGDCGVLPVIGDEGRVAGVITDRDICIAVATRGRTADRIAVREVVADYVCTCLPEDDVAAALRAMEQHKVRRLPVINTEGQLQGILSLNDIVTRKGAASPAQVVEVLAAIGEHRSIVVPEGATQSSPPARTPRQRRLPAAKSARGGGPPRAGRPGASRPQG